MKCAKSKEVITKRIPREIYLKRSIVPQAVFLFLVFVFVFFFGWCFFFLFRLQLGSIAHNAIVFLQHVLAVSILLMRGIVICIFRTRRPCWSTDLTLGIPRVFGIPLLSIKQLDVRSKCQGAMKWTITLQVAEKAVLQSG